MLFAGDAIATWPRLSDGWPASNLNPAQHRLSLRRSAELEANVVAVGHGEPLTEDAAAQVMKLAVGAGG